MASWNNQPQNQAYSGRPSANPKGGSLTKDDIQIERLSPKTVDPTTLIKNAFEFIKAQPVETAVVPIGLFIALLIAQQIIGIPLNLIASFAGAAIGESLGGDAGQFVAEGISISASIFVQIISTVLMTALLGGINILWLRVVRQQPVSINDMVAVKSFIIPLIFTSILMQIAVFGGILLLVVPGIMLSLGLAMAQYIVIDKNLKPIDALKASWQLMDGHKVEFFILGLILMVLNFAGMLAFCVGMFVTYAISIGAMASYYNAIAEPGNAYANDIGNTPDVFR